MIDARGRSCPEPVMMLKQAMKQAANEYEIWVDCKVAVENVSRYGSEQGYQVSVTEQPEMTVITLRK